MTGDDLRKLRERRGLDRDELAALINQALGKDYSGESVARWERGRKPSRHVEAFLDELAVGQLLPPLEADGETPAAAAPDDPYGPDSPPGDSAPGPGPSAVTQPKVGGSNAWTTACTELWEMIATGVGMMGAVVGSPALMADGAIIAADKEALGQAWGKLAETNETFRKMLVSMTEGGAWLQVALITGTTLSKCWQNHAQIAQMIRDQATENGYTGTGEPAPVAA